MNWWRGVFRRRRYEDLAVSIEEHIALKAEELMEAGMPRAEAEQAARRAFGNRTVITERSREAWQWPLVESIWADMRYAVRQMRRNPGFAAVSVGTLALGIGAATALFTVVDHVLLRPVMYRDAGRLVQILKSTSMSPGGTTPAWADIEQWMWQSRSFDSMAYFTGMGPRNFIVTGASSAQVSGEQVSGNLFDTLGVRPELGRGFNSASAQGGKDDNAAVLSDAVWRGVFGGDKGIVGKAIQINNQNYTVIGVMPRGFKFPANMAAFPQIWTFLDPVEGAAANNKVNASANVYYTVLARLRQGVTLENARAEMNVVQGRVAAQYKDSDYMDPEERKSENRAVLRPYTETLVDADMRRALLALLGASLVLWLIAVVNVTNLLLARGMARQREIAMRGALGASRGRVLQQMLVEGLMLSGAASALGLGLAVGSVALLARQLRSYLPVGAPALMPDAWILLALLAMTGLTAILATLWPAWMASHAPIEPALRLGGVQAGTGRRQHQLRGALVSIEIAMSLTLLVSCGLLLRTIYALRQVPLGYRVDHILVARLDIPRYRFTGRDVSKVLYEPLLQRVQKVTGVQAAGLMSEVPLGHHFRVQLGLTSGGKSITAVLKMVSPDVQRLFGMRMLAGRFFSAADTPGSDGAVVVNQAFARAYAPDKHDLRSVIGMTMWELKKDKPLRIVGVLDDERQMSVASSAAPEVEICTRQITPDVGLYALSTSGADLAVRTDRPEREMMPELRALLRQAAPELESAEIKTMNQVVEDSYGSQRLAAQLLEGFGGAALLLCVGGLYGLLAYIVAQRTHELGIRIALGAERGDLLWLVMRQAGAMLLGGVVVGTGLAYASGRLVRGFLYGVKAHDGWTLAGAAIVLLACGLAAAWLPARRAAGVNPMEALRSE
ncbi:MAG TPA: ABC transporter permease [Terracidiphilus sp.]|jgi:predicted permease|nr:ABC transporter permease [Terracidiphilus sp.]